MGAEGVVALKVSEPTEQAGIPGSSTLRRGCQPDGRTVAVRLIGAEPGDRFDYTALACEALSQHPHIVTVLDFGVGADGRTQLLLELLEEGSLGEWVANEGRLPLGEALDVALKLSGALETAHRAGVCHGRLSPRRILVSSAGEPVLAGLDRAVFRTAATVHGPGAPTAADDVRGLGSTLFTLLTGALHETEEPAAALQRWAVPGAVGALIQACLSDDPSERPPSMAALAASIQRLQAGLGVPVGVFTVDDAAAGDALDALRVAAAAPGSPAAEPAPRPEGAAEPEEAPEPAVARTEAKPAPEPDVEDAADTELAATVTIEPEAARIEAEPEPEDGAWTKPETEPAAEAVVVPVPPPPTAGPFIHGTPASELAPTSAPLRAARLRQRISLPRLRWQRGVKFLLLVLLAAVGAILPRLWNTVVSERTAGPPPTVAGSPEPVAERPAADHERGARALSRKGQPEAGYSVFRTVTDETGGLSMTVPEQWSAVRSSSWTLAGEDVGIQLEAAAAGEGWSASRPSALLAVSEKLRGRSAAEVLDELRRAAPDCTYGPRQPFDDNLYAGAIESYSGCGGAGVVEVLVARPRDGSSVVLLKITQVAARDVTARNRVLETFIAG